MLKQLFPRLFFKPIFKVCSEFSDMVNRGLDKGVVCIKYNSLTDGYTVCILDDYNKQKEIFNYVFPNSYGINIDLDKGITDFVCTDLETSIKLKKLIKRYKKLDKIIK